MLSLILRKYKKLQNFRNFSAPGAQQECVDAASVRCSNIAAALGEVESEAGSEFLCVQRRDHAEFAQKFHEKTEEKKKKNKAAL